MGMRFFGAEAGFLYTHEGRDPIGRYGQIFRPYKKTSACRNVIQYGSVVVRPVRQISIQTIEIVCRKNLLFRGVLLGDRSKTVVTEHSVPDNLF